MNVELTKEELDLILRALQEHVSRRQSHGMSTDQAKGLVRKLLQEPANPRGNQPKS